ncbi:MAG: hypothetical protein ABJC26_12465 [Gemmatimonadaceae bacterium]
MSREKFDPLHGRRSELVFAGTSIVTNSRGLRILPIANSDLGSY